jgi:hypothetical protein
MEGDALDEVSVTCATAWAGARPALEIMVAICSAPRLEFVAQNPGPSASDCALLREWPEPVVAAKSGSQPHDLKRLAANIYGLNHLADQHKCISANNGERPSPS